MQLVSGYSIVFVEAGIGGAMRHGVNVAFRGLGSGFPYENPDGQCCRLSRDGCDGGPVRPQV